MAKVTKEAKMAVGAERLLSVITGFEKYPEFVDEVVSATRTGGDDIRPRVTFELEVVKRFQYVLDFDLSRENEVHWVLVESNFFKKNVGAWILQPEGENSTHAIYELDVDFGFLVPKWVTKKLTEVNLPKMMSSFEQRAQTQG